MIPVPLPPAVRPGDRVGVAALSGPVDALAIERGLATIADLGFEPVPAANLARVEGLFAGSDAERLEAFHELARRADVGPILFARGGHGVTRLLGEIDWGLLASVPRAYVGYSDLTPFLAQVVERLRFAAYHGPMVGVELARGLDAAEADSLVGWLTGSPPASLPVDVIGGHSRGEGPLLGGCLSLLTGVLGTPFQVPLRGSVLFWEDVDEPLYRIDRMLTQLRHAGSLEGLSGMIVGSSASATAEVGQLVTELGDWFGFPVAIGAPCGHCRPNLTAPLGVSVRLTPGSDRVEILAP